MKEQKLIEVLNCPKNAHTIWNSQEGEFSCSCI